MSLQLGVRAHLGLHLRLGNACMRVGVTLYSVIGVLCTATCRANPTNFFALEEPPNDQLGQLLSGFIELRKELLKQQGEANSQEIESRGQPARI